MAQIGWQSRYTYTPQHDPQRTLEDLDVLPGGIEGRTIGAELAYDITRRVRELEQARNRFNFFPAVSTGINWSGSRPINLATTTTDPWATQVTYRFP